MTSRYQLVVTGKGVTYDGSDRKEARRLYRMYVTMAKNTKGMKATLFKNGAIVSEFHHS
jgi:hypothetical protein